MKVIVPSEIPVSELHGYMLGTVTPRPIAFASTISKNGEVNLSPFSFFNAFSANPPILIFSPARRGMDNTTKHTYDNVMEVPEVVVNMVTYSMVQQMSLSSSDYPKGLDEFVKAGFTPEPAQMVKPPRVKESPVAFECKVNDVIPLGDRGGAGNLVIAEIMLIRIDESILNEEGKVDPFRLDSIGRMGGNWYTRASGEALFEVVKPSGTLGIGVDQLPEPVRNSRVLTGNDLGVLAGVPSLPGKDQVEGIKNEPAVKGLLERYPNNGSEFEYELHLLAKGFIEKGDIEAAWSILMLNKV